MNMLNTYRAAIIGVGKGGEGKAGGHSIGYAHADAYAVHPRTTLAAGCDLSPENLERFAKAYELPAKSQDARALLAETKPDIVSICTYAGSHRTLLELCLEAGVKGIWCEKPLALTLDDARAMERAATLAGVKVVVNHFRRYNPLFRQAKRLLEDGAIGQVSMIFSSIENWDLMEWGTHWLDMMRFLSGDQPVRWVMGQARCTGEKQGYGHVMEEHAIAYFAFNNGVRGFLDGGVAIPGTAPYSLKAIGSDGSIEMSESKLTLLNHEGVRQIEAAASTDPAQSTWQLQLADFIGWLDGGSESQLSLRNAVLSTELYLAAYESAKSGDRIDLPLISQSRFPLDAVAQRQSGN